MAKKLLYIAAVMAAGLILVGAEDCKCSEEKSMKEVQELWDFLTPIEADNDPYHVVPGELSPLLPCSNCLETNRRKRKIEDRAEKERKREERSPYFRAWRHVKDERNKCPIGYIRVAFMCVKYPR